MFKHTSYYTVTRIRFEFRKSRPTKLDPEAPLTGTAVAIMYIEGQGVSDPITTFIRCTRSDWDARGKPRPSHAAQLLNKGLVKWEESIYSAAKSLHDKGEPITPQNLIQEKNIAGQHVVTLKQVYQAYVAFKEKQIGSDCPQERHSGQITKSTFITYAKRWACLRRYLVETRQPNMLAYKATSPFINAYYTWLQTQQLSPTTATKYAKLLSEILHWGVGEGLIKNMVVEGFRGQGGATTPPHNVTEEEVQRIEALVFNDPKMDAIRDGWLLARELCLHYSDYVALRPEHFTLNKDNRVVFEKARQKQESGRNIRQIAYVSERALAIWKRYGYEIPYSSKNNDFNNCLKEVGYLAELSKPLSFCHARDSGIFRWVTLGVPDVQTKLAAGWRTAQPLVRYVNFDRRLLDEFSAPTVQGFARPLHAPQGPRLIDRETNLLAS